MPAVAFEGEQFGALGGGIAARGARAPTPLDQLREVVQAVSVPVQAVGGLSIQQAIECPAHGAPLVVVAFDRSR